MPTGQAAGGRAAAAAVRVPPRAVRLLPRLTSPRLRVCAAAPGGEGSTRGAGAAASLLELPTVPAPASGLAAPLADRTSLGGDGSAPQQSAALQQQPLDALDASLLVQGVGLADAQALETLLPSEPTAAPEPRASAAHTGTLWGLLVMTLGYLHLSVTIYALPSLLPMISEDLQLSDPQGGLLTTGYTVVYGLALIPAGLLADSVHRPRLLAGGIALWSLFTMAASQSQSFSQLMATRVGFAVAQGVQNPVAYSLIPELFPANRTAAMAVYNSAIYLGRALSFVVVILAGQQAAGLAEGGASQLPALGEAGAALGAAAAAWRPLLWWLGPPGLAAAALALWTMEEPRRKGEAGRFLPLVTLSSDSEEEAAERASVATAGAAAAGDGWTAGGAAAAASLAAPAAAPAPAAAAAAAPAKGRLVSAPAAAAPAGLGDSLAKLRQLAGDRSFQALTAAAAAGDVASWALIGWQATFYQRVYELEPSVYAPMLAIIIPVGGIMGGVGAAVFGDRLTARGARGWLTAGTSLAAAPLVAASLLVEDYRLSFAALLMGYALSECWRSPAAVMVREVSPPGLGSTASALHLCIRGLAGALGPIGVALLAVEVGLQHAMLLIPACHLAAGVGLAATEEVLKSEHAKAKAKAAALPGELASLE